MSVILFSGSHARHVYVHEYLLESDVLEVEGVVSMQRESTMPTPPSGWPEHDRELFTRHFERRAEVERERYGERSTDTYHQYAPTIHVEPEELNGDRVHEFVRRVDPDIAFIFGTGLIRDPVLSALPDWKLNFHLGLSPWYKGSATLFWPFYFLEPQYSGGTLHKIVESPDAGAMVHHTVPDLERGQGIHEVAADVVADSADDTRVLLEHLAATGHLPTEPQRSTGKLFRKDDFDPHHLRVVYDLYDNAIVDEYLDGNLGDDAPDLVDAFERLDDIERP